jgi:hypothetical protein
MTRELTVAMSYVLREADGQEVFEEFIESLERFPIHKSTCLYIILKECTEQFRLRIQEKVQESIPMAQLVVGSDGGFDLGSHLEIAKNASSDLLVLFTSSSQPTSNNWMQSLLRPFRDQRVGIVGTMYSNESLKSSYLLVLKLKLKHKLRQNLNNYERQLSDVWGISVQKIPFVFRIFDFVKVSDFLFRKIEVLALFLIARINPWKSIKNFPEFPNPHIRTTGFAIRRDLYIEILDRTPVSKFEAFSYESGRDSITNRVLGLGYKVGLVLENGNFIPIDNPEAKKTFRFPGTNSLISDHQSRRYHTLTRRQKLALTKITQGI